MEKRILWLILGIVFFIIEIFTPGLFFSACLGFSAMLTFLLSLLTHEFYVQLIFFVVMATISTFVAYKIAYKISPSAKQLTVGLDSIIGKTVTIEDKFENGDYRVKVNGEVWHAIPSSDTLDTFYIGEKAVIVKIEGTKLVLKKHKPSPS